MSGCKECGCADCGSNCPTQQIPGSFYYEVRKRRSMEKTMQRSCSNCTKCKITKYWIASPNLMSYNYHSSVMLCSQNVYSEEAANVLRATHLIGGPHLEYKCTHFPEWKNVSANHYCYAYYQEKLDV